MALLTPWPSIRQALIRLLRANLVLEDEIDGRWAQGFNPQQTDFPLGTITMHYAPSAYDWTGRVVFVGVDVIVWAKAVDDADRIFQLAFSTLQDARLELTGQTSLQCRFLSDIALSDVDAGGNTVFSSGGVLEIRVAQSSPTLSTLTFTGDSTIA